MLLGLTAAVILIVTICLLRDGLFSAFCTFVCVLISGLIAFNFFEPLANLLEPSLRNSAVQGFEDFLCLVGLFAASLLALRVIVNVLNSHLVEYHFLMNRGGGAFFGLITGYLVSGFLIVAMQTLPWHENFLGFEPYHEKEPPLRNLLPPDRAWLWTMRHAGAYPFARRIDEPATNPEPLYPHTNTFDRWGTFENRYRFYRRYGDNRPPKLARDGEKKGG